MQITLYGTSNYDRGGKVRWLLEELGKSYDNVWIKSDADYADYLKVNPLGQIPSAKIGDHLMIESGAICMLLADQRLEAMLAPRLESSARAEYLQWMFFGLSVGTFAGRIQIIEDIPEGSLKNQKMDSLREDLTDAVDFLGTSLKESEYLLGKFTAADVCVGYHFYYASLWPELSEVIEHNPIVSLYMSRLKVRPAAVTSKVFTYASST